MSAPWKTSISVRHNMEVAHRLTALQGKCENIHGHSMYVRLDIWGETSPAGVLIEFADVKYRLRSYLDTYFDHHLLLNESDPIAELMLPGANKLPCDPTTENLARLICEWARNEFGADYIYRVEVQETPTNFATYTEAPE